MRTRPAPAIGIAIGLLYPVLFIGLVLVLGGDYGRLDEASALPPFIASVGVCAVALVVLTTVLGWWRPVLRDRSRLGGPFVAVPIVMAAAIVASAALSAFWTLPLDRLALTAFLVLLVGFAEEVAYRGLALTGLRGGSTELRAWLVSTFLFAILHLPNVLVGAAPAAVVVQTLLAFVGGTCLYAARRATAGIAVAIALHAGWDFASFVAGANAAGTLLQFGAYAVVIAILVAGRRRAFDRAAASQLVEGGAAA